MGTNRITGMYSGLDTESLINSLMEAKSKKVDNKKKDQMSLKYKQDAWEGLNKKVKSFFNNLSNYRFQSSYAKFKTDVSDSSVASVVTSDNAMTAAQSLKVNKLATSGYLTGGRITTGDGAATSGTLLSDISGMSDKIGSTISISSNGKTENIEITSDMTLGDLTSRLSSVGVNAKFDSASQRIFIGATASGADKDFSISGDLSTLESLGLDYGVDADGKATGHAVKIQGGNAEIELNGATYTSNTNVFEINGLTITAKATTGDKEVTLNTARDTSAMYDMIKKLVNEYSELMNEMDKLYNAKVDKGYKPLTDEEKSALSEYEVEKWEKQLSEQALAKDSSISELSSKMRSVLGKGFEVNGKTMYLHDFGIEEPSYLSAADNQKHALHIYGDKDDDIFASENNKLEYMITSDPDSVTEFFSSLSKSLYSALNEASSKIVGYRSYGSFFDDLKYKSEYSDYTSKIADMESKLADYEDKWYKKFSKMETAMAKMQSNSSAISSLFSN